MRQLRVELGTQNSVSVHLTLVPHIRAAGEFKTKPTQHSVQKLREIGVQCDVLVVRCEQKLPEEALKKMAMFCSVASDAVFQSIDVDTVYRLPLDAVGARPRSEARGPAQHLVARVAARCVGAGRRADHAAEEDA